MTPPLAALICTFFILYLFWLDRHSNNGVSRAIWIPFFWMFLAGSRYVSQWLSLRSANVSSMDVYTEGSPIDMAVFLFLIAASIVILIRRKVNWHKIFKNNHIICSFFIFALFSTLWSDYPFVSFKRLVKSLGTVSVALIILTEERPYAALGVIMKRLAFLLLPLSLLFIKYYPDLGRQYHSTGSQMFTGVTLQKNSLGELCMLLGIYFCWNLIYVNRERIDLGRRLHSFTYWAILLLIAWLLDLADSATSLVCLVVAISLFLVGRIPAMANNSKRITTFFIACIGLYGMLQLTFDINTQLISILGRRPDLTTRVPMWEDLLAMAGNPYVGYGWQSFYLGNRLDIVFAKWAVLSTHNGYLDIYLNLGIIGLVFFLVWVVSGLIKVRRLPAIDFQTALLRLSFILVVVLYNWTETLVMGVSNMYFILLLGTMDVPMAIRDSSDPSTP